MDKIEDKKYAKHFSKVKINKKTGFIAFVAIEGVCGEERLIGGASLSSLKRHWLNITGTELDTAKAQKVTIFKAED